MQQISESVYVETGLKGCNLGLVVTPQGVILIDSPQHPADALRWKEEAEAKGQIAYVINTEHHVDHVMGNSFLPGTAVGTFEVRNALSRPGLAEEARDVTVQLWPDSAALLERYSLRLPGIAFRGTMSLYLGNTEVELIHLPGHVAGGLAVHIPQEKVVFTGDNIVCNFGPAFHDALPAEWLSSLTRIESLGAQTVVPGHGPVCGDGYVSEFAREIRGVIEEVKEAIKRGATREEAMDHIDFLSKYEAFGITLNDIRREHQREGIAHLYDVLRELGGTRP